MLLPQLRRVRWAVRATLVLGVAASVAANILHAEPNPISQVIAAWPPLALLLTVELISRVPVHRRSLAAVRLGATTTIAGIAAWVSYWHMAGVASRYGETGASPYLLPLSVDGLVIVASVSLVELAGRVRIAEEARAAERQAERVRSDADAAANRAAVTANAGSTANAATTSPSTAGAANNASAARAKSADGTMNNTDATNNAGSTPPVSHTGLLPDGATTLTREMVTAANGQQPAAGQGTDTPTPRKATAARATKRTQPRRTSPARDEKAPAKRATGKKTPTARARRPVEETAALAAEIQAAQPDLTQADIAAQLGITTQRLRQIKRLVPATQPAEPGQDVAAPKQVALELVS